MREHLHIVLLAALLGSCSQATEPDYEVVARFPHPVDLDDDGVIDATFDLRFVGHETAYAEMLSLWPERGNYRFALEGGRTLQPGMTVGPANEWTTYPHPQKYPFWSIFPTDYSTMNYDLRNGKITYYDGTGPDGVYHGIRVGQGDTARYGWIRFRARAYDLKRSFGTVLEIQGKALGKPGVPIVVGERP